MLEELVHDQDGQPLTGLLHGLPLPRTDDVPFFDFEIRNVPSTANQLGTKVAGEAGAIGAR